MGQCLGRQVKPLPRSRRPEKKTAVPVTTANGSGLQNSTLYAIDDFIREQDKNRQRLEELERQMKILVRKEIAAVIPQLIITVTKAVTSQLTTHAHGLYTTTGVATSTPTLTSVSNCEPMQGSDDESTETILSQQEAATAKRPATCTNDATPHIESRAIYPRSSDCMNSTAIHTHATSTPTTSTVSVDAHPCSSPAVSVVDNELSAVIGELYYDTDELEGTDDELTEIFSKQRTISDAQNNDCYSTCVTAAAIIKPIPVRPVVLHPGQTAQQLQHPGTSSSQLRRYMDKPLSTQTENSRSELARAVDESFGHTRVPSYSHFKRGMDASQNHAHKSAFCRVFK